MNPENNYRTSQAPKLKGGSGGPNGNENAEEIQELSELVEKQAEEIEAKEQEIEMTAEVQKSLLPDKMPEIAGFDLSASYFAPEKAGGDYFDFLPLERDANHHPKPDGRWVVIIADAAGHGPAATVVVAMLHSLLYAFPGPHDAPEQILHFINGEMCTKDLASMFATAVLAILDPSRGEFHYSCAGHPSPLMRNAAGDVFELPRVRGRALAIKPDIRFESRRLHLQPCDALLLYTDGLIDGLDAKGRPFGLERLKHVFGGAVGTSRQRVDRINRAVAIHRGSDEQLDDQTFIVIQACERF
jgi:phosphoserine phosphatase RsbU/P